MQDEDPLLTPVQFVRGVGPHRAELLAKLGLVTVQQLLFNLPRDVIDLTRISKVFDLQEGATHTVRGTVVDRDSRQLNGGKSLTGITVKCDGGYVRALWFNQPWMLQKFGSDALVLISGVCKQREKRWEITHPRVQFLEEDERDSHGGMLPKYGLTEGLAMHEMRRITRSAVEDFVQYVADPLPESLRNRLEIPALREALIGLHQPQSAEQYAAARRRVILDDLLEFQLGLALRRRVWGQAGFAVALPASAKIDARIRRLFPFKFTNGQDGAIREIAADLNREIPMHRLLQADVGAGKTVVAVYAMLTAIAGGVQAVLMAPTEVLAQQHWDTVETLLAQSRVQRRMLTGSLGAAERRTTLAEIREGHAQLIVGTQAVIQESVEFAKLGLVVIDEQHKFGVMQRAQFNSATIQPHVLVMTATPIPRSIALTQFGDLDMTTISELPPGRQKIVTSQIRGPAVLKKAWDFVRGKLREGRQAYVVCPRIEAKDEREKEPVSDSRLAIGDDAGAEATFRRLQETELAGFRVGLVHGRLSRDEKQDVMQAFRDGELQVLVATTVIEVGVDVPNATVMVVQEAQQFGLSQLHQLRGRIGRGKNQGYCFLLSEASSPDAVRRLDAMVSTSDGFQLAEVDFELRGPGDVLGTRQSGSMPLRTADLVRDKDLLLYAREQAFALVTSGEFDSAELAPLKIQVLDRFRLLMDLPQSG